MSTIEPSFTQPCIVFRQTMFKTLVMLVSQFSVRIGTQLWALHWLREAAIPDCKQCPDHLSHV